MSDTDEIPTTWQTNSLEPRITFANTVKQILAEALYKEGKISGEVKDLIQNELAIVMVKKGLWGTIWDKIQNVVDAKPNASKEETYSIKIIRVFGGNKTPMTPDPKGFNRTIDTSGRKE